MKTNHLLILASYFIIAFLIGSCNRAEDSWENAKINNTKESYLAVIIKHSGSEYADSAFFSIKKILESQNNIENTIKYFEIIKDTIPPSKFLDSISNNLKQLYEKRPLFIIIKDGKVGYINKKGEIIIKPQFTSGLDFNRNTSLIQQDSLWGFIDKTGQILIKPQYLEVCGFSEGLAAVKQNDKWGFIDTSGNFVIPAKYSDAWPFSDSLALVELDDKWGFIDKTGKTVIDFTFKGGYYNENVSFELLINDTTRVYYYAEIGMTFIPEGAKFAYKDFNNVPIFKKDYEWLELSVQYGFYGDYKAFGYIDKKEPNSIHFSDIECVDVFSGNLALIFINGKWGFIDKTGKQFLSPTYSKCSRFIENFAIVEKNNGIGFINRFGDIAVQPNYSGAGQFNEKLAPICKYEKWGYIDTVGNIVIKPQFDECSWFYEDLALIKLNKKYGYINKNGDKVIEPQYVDAKRFSEGLAAVNIDKKWGFIDKTGKLVINVQFDEVENFKNELARVKLNKRVGYINNRGNIIWKPTR